MPHSNKVISIIPKLYNASLSNLDKELSKITYIKDIETKNQLVKEVMGIWNELNYLYQYCYLQHRDRGWIKKKDLKNFVLVYKN